MSSTAEISTDDADVTEPDGNGRRRRSGGRRGLTAAIVVTLLVVAGAGIVITDPFGPKEDDTPARPSTRTGVAEVARGTLSARTQDNGTLGYAGDYKVVNKNSGTVTKAPGVGTVVRQGKVLYQVDGKPVVFLYGAYVPAYRALEWRMKGADVQQLNAALVSLGYAKKSELDPDSNYFDWGTYYALRELQDDLGLKTTGKLPLGQAVFLSAKEVRVTKVGAVSGAPAQPGSVLMEVSSTQRQVTVALNASQQSDVAVGDKVTITLPNGKTTPGVVTSVGKVATKTDDSMTIDVRIKPLNAKATGELDQAPVQVSIVTGSVKNALTVPVNALLARAGGEYAVEVVGAGGKNRLIPVTTGLFDDSAGTVEVKGEGLRAGQKIVVPSS
ncbi:peptidoglycan-binding protein [Streptomyces sp. NPDC005322]|uniref:efflux RND transporter periplasmic adaptor subunit n=1 Tax=Streptomyces sp. NPDC005322 TaxID=3157032 RepID=UPI0033B13DA4